MANPRELAEQAFSLLQNALRASEARVSELDEQLRRKKAPKTKLEEQLDVLTHRLEAVEVERTRWQQQANHLEEIAEAERTKVAQLRKKLEIAESGPEKLTKKEINFWRAKAEEIDNETKEYKTRLANLRRELIERDALIEKLRDGRNVDIPTGTPAEPGGMPVESADDVSAEAIDSAGVPSTQVSSAAVEDLRWQLEQRDHRLAELQTELAALRESQEQANSGQSLEIHAQVETLRRQISTFDNALSEAHSARASLKAELAQALSAVDKEQRASREAQAGAERARTTLAEREHRVVELSGELEQLRSQLRQRDNQFSEATEQRDAQIAALSRDLENERRRAESERAAIDAERARMADADRDRDELRARNAEALRERDELLATLAEALRRAEQLVADAEAKQGQVDDYRAQLEAANRTLEEQRQQLARKSDELGNRDRDVADREAEHTARARQLEQQQQDLAERERAMATLSAELEQARSTLESSERELITVRNALVGANTELEKLRGQKQHLELEVTDALARCDVVATELSRTETELRMLVEQRAALERERGEISQQMAGLESELREEKEHAENMSELANERRDLMTKLQEQLEEVEERYEEAKYRLTKSAHFERLVRRRKGLIGKLLAALRAKAKANTALKAGLDGLRTYKAAADLNQQKLLQRIDTLKTELREAEEAIARRQGATHANEQVAAAEAKVTALEGRLNTQAELIQALEGDLKAARAGQKFGGDKSQEIESLHKELETKTQVIVQLQADVDDLQRKLAKLRGSEGETLRLKAMTEKDRSAMDAMEREIAQLREALSQQGAAQGGGDTAELEAKLKERENSVTRLMGTIKEHEATIKKLAESADSWKRKYQFLASDSPDAYQSAAEK
jgi:chromosome segregation ATPase